LPEMRQLPMRVVECGVRARRTDLLRVVWKLLAFEVQPRSRLRGA